MVKYLILLLLLFLSIHLPTAWAAVPLSRQEALSYLNSVKEENRKRLSEIDASIQGKMVDQSKSTELDQSLTKFEKDIESLSRARKEHLLRQDFLDRLSFQIDSHYKGDDLKAFLQMRLMEMARVESTSLNSEDSLWKFMTYLSVAVKELPERGENLLEFVEGYMKYSSILSPIKPGDFLARRHYTNGMSSVSSATAGRGELGEIVEQRLKEGEQPSLKEKLPLPQPTAVPSSSH